MLMDIVHSHSQDLIKSKIPSEGVETKWQNGSGRKDSLVFNGKFLVPSIMVDINYTYSFRNPNGNTVIGLTALVVITN